MNFAWPHRCHLFFHKLAHKALALTSSTYVTFALLPFSNRHSCLACLAGVAMADGVFLVRSPKHGLNIAFTAFVFIAIHLSFAPIAVQ